MPILAWFGTFFSHRFTHGNADLNLLYYSDMTVEWTLEMLRMPAMWNTVEAIAEMLISMGEITTNGDEEMFFNI